MDLPPSDLEEPDLSSAGAGAAVVVLLLLFPLLRLGNLSLILKLGPFLLGPGVPPILFPRGASVNGSSLPLLGKILGILGSSVDVVLVVVVVVALGVVGLLVVVVAAVVVLRVVGRLVVLRVVGGFTGVLIDGRPPLFWLLATGNLAPFGCSGAEVTDAPLKGCTPDAVMGGPRRLEVPADWPLLLLPLVPVWPLLVLPLLLLLLLFPLLLACWSNISLNRSFELEVSVAPLDPKKNPDPDPDTGVPISALLS